MNEKDKMITEYDRIIEYNPPTNGTYMINDKWTDRFIELAKTVASWSKDPSTKVGAVIVDVQRRVVGMGYNGFPRGVDDHFNRLNNRELKYKFVVHAEVNAILNATRDVRGCTLYSTFFPCPQCAALIVQAGIARIVTVSCPADKRWEEELVISRTIFNEANVDWIVKA